MVMMRCIFFLVLVLYIGVEAGRSAGGIVYDVSPGRNGSCIMVSHGQESSCIELSYFLQSFNDTINTTLEVHMSAGHYQLSSSSPIYINYSLVLTGDGDVNVTCMEKDNISTTLHFKENGNISLYGITFKDCNNSFRFNNMDSLTIINCTFREFSSSAVDVFNVLNVQIKSTQFINNSASYINDRHRGAAAGLSISYIYQHSPAANPTVNVDNCTFDNNRVSLPSEDLSEQISEVLNRQYYPARGGALSIIITESYANLTINVEDCLFTRNYAESFGGGIFFHLDGSQQTTHSIKFIRNDFIDNKCSGGGGAVLLGFFKKFSDDIPTQVLFDGCSFHGNSASSGAGLLSVKVRINGGRDYTVVNNCTFTNNNSTRGSALVFGSLFDTVQSDIDLFTSLVQNCTFTDNASPGGTLIAGFTHVTMRGYNTFTTNTGPTMLVIGCLINIYGNVTFVGNRNTVAGGVALHLSSFAQIKLTNTSHISFINNSGTLGAAMRVDLQQFPVVYSSLIFNPLCFLLYEDDNTPPVAWQPDLIHFSGNQANIGSAIYASYLDLCSYFSSNKSDISGIFNISQFPHWPIFDFKINNNTSHKDSTNKRFYVQTPALSIDSTSINHTSFQIRPGEISILNITGLDQFNNPTYFVARVVDEDISLAARLSSLFDVTPSFIPPLNYSNVYFKTDKYIAIFSPSLIPVYPNTSSEISYGIELPSQGDEGYISGSIDKSILIQVQNQNGYSSFNLTLSVLQCDPGYQLRPLLSDELNTVECVCVGAIDNKFAVLDCENGIILRDGYWAGYSIQDDGSRRLLVYTCPSTYCKCTPDSCVYKYVYTDPDAQCNSLRQGVLCGACKNESTVTILRMQCKENCHDSVTLYYALPLLIVADVVLIIIVLVASIKLKVSFPHSLRGVVFYIQTVYIASEYFPISFLDSRQYMLYFGNILGLYFPYDFCFISGAPSVLTFLPRFIPSLLIFIIPLAFLCTKRAKLKIWHGVWSLIQLTYAPLCYTCFSLLHCTFLANNSGHDYVMRWFLDGEIKCFSDPSHIVLGILAIVFLLVFIIGLIPSIIMLVVLEDRHFIQIKYPFLINIISALKAGYKQQWKWWGGFELFQRLLIIGLAVGLPGRTVAPVYILAFLFILYLYIRPHGYLIQNIIQVVIMINYILLFVIQYPFDPIIQTHPSDQTDVSISDDPFNFVLLIVFYFPVVFGVGVCIVWMVYTIWKMYKKRKDGSLEEREVSLVTLRESHSINDVDHTVDMNTRRSIASTYIDFDSLQEQND